MESTDSWLLFHSIRENVLVRSSPLPQRRPPREHTFIERHADRVHLTDRAIEMSLEVAMSAKGLADVASPPVLGVQLDRFEILYIV